jgi:hypothetical protein
VSRPRARDQTATPSVGARFAALPRPFGSDRRPTRDVRSRPGATVPHLDAALRCYTLGHEAERGRRPAATTASRRDHAGNLAGRALHLPPEVSRGPEANEKPRKWAFLHPEATRVCRDVFQKGCPQRCQAKRFLPFRMAKADARIRTADPFITSDAPEVTAGHRQSRQVAPFRHSDVTVRDTPGLRGPTSCARRVRRTRPTSAVSARRGLVQGRLGARPGISNELWDNSHEASEVAASARLRNAIVRRHARADQRRQLEPRVRYELYRRC